MGQEIERNLGPQPIAGFLEAQGLAASDLVKASREQITHKMVARACKGRRLTDHVKGKLVRAFNAASGQERGMADLFNY